MHPSIVSVWEKEVPASLPKPKEAAKFNGRTYIWDLNRLAKASHSYKKCLDGIELELSSGRIEWVKKGSVVYCPEHRRRRSYKVKDVFIREPVEKVEDIVMTMLARYPGNQLLRMQEKGLLPTGLVLDEIDPQTMYMSPDLVLRCMDDLIYPDN